MHDFERDLGSEIVALVNSDLVFSDLQIEENEPIMAKTPSGWVALDDIEPALREDITLILERFDSDWADRIKSRAMNFLLDLTNCRLRLNAYLAFRGTRLMLSIRKISPVPPALKDTGLPETVRLLLDHPKGLIILNGSTGSGKSTSLASIVDAINEQRRCHIVTIEDPIEFRFQRKKSIFSQREIGVDVESFFDGTRDALRQRPDVIVIGEIRDKDTAETAIIAAESGVLVIGTLHANNASSAVQKLLSYFGANERESKLASLQSVLLGVISHQLLPTADGRGWALASEILFNQKQQCSKVLGNPEQLATYLERKEDKLSYTMADSLFNLVQSQKVNKSEAVRAMVGNGQASFLERVKHL